MPKPIKRLNNKAVNFDLDTNVIKTLIANGTVRFKDYTAPYGKIRYYLEKNGLQHDQGSGYVSRNPMSARAIQKIFHELGKKNPWLAGCFTACRLTSFDAKGMVRTDLIPSILNGAKQASANAGLLPSPTTYKPVKDEPKINEALKTSLKKTNIKPCAPIPAQGAAAAPKPAPAAKTKALIKSKSYGK